MVTSKRHWCQLAGSLVVCYRTHDCQHFHCYFIKKRACNSSQLTCTEWQLHAAYCAGCWGKKAPSIYCSIWEWRRNVKWEDLDISLSLPFTIHMSLDKSIHTSMSQFLTCLQKLERDNYQKLWGSHEVIWKCFIKWREDSRTCVILFDL